MEFLEQEYERFREVKAELLRTHKGKFVLIQGKSISGVFDSMDEAASEGYKRFGRGPFLVEPIVEKKKTVFLAHLTPLRSKIGGHFSAQR